MAREITMPKLSDTMTEGHLGAWLKNVGDKIERGDIIAEVETDKATMDLEAFTSGVLLEQRVRAGELVAVGTVIGLIGEKNETVFPQLPGAPPEIPIVTPAEASPIPSTINPPEKQSWHNADHGIQAAPIVHRRAAEMGIDLGLVHGSGPDGRILLEDLALHVQSGMSGSMDPPKQISSDEATQVEEQAETAQPSRMRSAIARTTIAAWHSIPHFYITREIEMAPSEQIVHKLKSEGIRVSLNAMILAAAASALTVFPALNSCYGEQGIFTYPAVNLSFAVALDDGLQMPVIRDAETKGVSALTAEAVRLAARARQGVLSASEISGGSFSVSNLGMYGVDSLASIIMPGQAGILGIGSVADRPLVRNGTIEIASIMTATLSCDHRIVDGVTAAAFINEFKRLLEHPAELPA